MAEDTFSPLLISFFFPGRFYTITLGFAHLEVRNSFFFPQCEDKENSRFSLESQTPPLPPTPLSHLYDLPCKINMAQGN